MTTLTITPRLGTKDARFKGTVAAGERVAVTITGAAGWIDTGLKLRVIDHCCKTLAVFPAPDTNDAWAVSGGDLTCTLNLNTLQMLKAVPPRAIMPFRFVLSNAESDTLYFSDDCDVVHWPHEAGDEVPYDLDAWPGQIEAWEQEVQAFGESLNNHISDEERHITAAERTAWNSKADATDLNNLAQRVDELPAISDTLIGQTLNTNTPNAMRNSLRIIGAALGATMRIAAICFLLPCFGASVSLTPLGDLDLDSNPTVVTSVSFDGLLTEHQNISGKADKTNTYTKAETDARIVELSPPGDYSTNNTELVATIEATAPAPGDYANVSNRAMSALSRSEAEAGCTAWRFSDESLMDGSHVAEVREGWSDEAQGVRYYDLYVDGQFESGYTGRIGETTIEFTWQGDGSVTATRTRLRPTADQEAYWSAKASHEDVTNVAEAVVREKSLGGIWDRDLEVWWTPKMRNGCLTYEATTNVNLSAGN